VSIIPDRFLKPVRYVIPFSGEFMIDKEKNTEKARFLRGSTLTIFKSDRHEDWMALVLSLLIALGVYLLVP